jgi:hypothetical protein
MLAFSISAVRISLSKASCNASFPFLEVYSIFKYKVNQFSLIVFTFHKLLSLFNNNPML